MSKTIEEIKDQVAKELGYSKWVNIGHDANSEKRNNEVAERYSQSKTETIKHLAGVNSELKKKTQELIEQNRELVANVQLLLQSLDYDALGVMSGLIIEDLKELLTKFKHLNQM